MNSHKFHKKGKEGMHQAQSHFNLYVWPTQCKNTASADVEVL